MDYITNPVPYINKLSYNILLNFTTQKRNKYCKINVYGLLLCHEETFFHGTFPPIFKFGGRLSMSIDLNVLVSLGLADV